MHDTILFDKISAAVSQICSASNIKKVNKLAVVVSYNSPVDENNLKEHLQNTNSNLVGQWTKILVERDDILEQSAILHSILGDQV
jgi:hypothetical protein